MTYHTITSLYQDSVVVITLNRPHKKNAMDFVMMRELLSAAKTIKQDKRVRAVIITGKDDFCSGLDLAVFNSPKLMAQAAYELIKPTPSLFQKVCLVWQSLPVPVVAVIDGVCLGAGLQLALGADIRISSGGARFAILEAKWGLVADMGLTHTAKGVIAADTLKELATTARTIDSQSAKSVGLVGHVSDEPMAMARRLCDQWKARSPDAVLAAKRLINGMHQSSYWQLYQEKLWQLKLMLGTNRKLAVKKAKDAGVAFVARQFD
ncbi:MAG: crotonase/enoyl-CoA hydratase family protein [Moraxella sp.]|nr:crotonase/enoyl-CoA hydratase family protein [Moraxella sp.]